MNGFNICFPDFFCSLKSRKNMSQGFCNSRDTTKDLPYSDSIIWYCRSSCNMKTVKCVFYMNHRIMALQGKGRPGNGTTFQMSCGLHNHILTSEGYSIAGTAPYVDVLYARPDCDYFFCSVSAYFLVYLLFLCYFWLFVFSLFFGSVSQLPCLFRFSLKVYSHRSQSAAMYMI